MENHLIVFSFLVFALFFNPLCDGGLIPISTTNEDGSEAWGYVEVRPKAHMFWWYYRSPNRAQHPTKPWPIILWLQGGPGASGVGIGNFEEIGPLDKFLKPRNSTWLTKADLLFVDNPVGSGYSYVEDRNLLVKKSYGGKFAVTLGLSALRAIDSGKLKLKLGGALALGDTWISPEDFVFSWGPLLKDVSRLDNNGLYAEATNSWSELERVIISSSNSVDFYNFLLDAGMDPLPLSGKMGMRGYLNSIAIGAVADLSSLMNTEIKKKLNIIPQNVTWGGQSGLVFDALQGDFMRPRINEDILALLEFKKGIKHDPMGFVLDSWNDESIDFNGCPSSWNGIICNGGNVTTVVLDNLGDFKTLEYLDISENLFSSSLPSEFGKLTSLKNLSLAGNNFSGSIPDSISQLASR
ncbi:hypothetical protein ACS0TY_014564 [Phlomoides rotata]